MKTLRTFLLLLKLNLKKPGFYLIILLMPLFTILLNLASSKGDDQISVGIFLDGNHDNETPQIRSLLESAEGLFSYTIYEDETTLSEDVLSQKLEIGYLIPADYVTKMVEGKKDKLIKRILSPSTTMQAVTDESLYSLLFPLIEKRVMTDYLYEDSPLKEYHADVTREEIEMLFDSYLVADTAFTIGYEKAPSDSSMKASDILFSPLRGILAHMILIAGLAGGLAFYKDPNHYGYRQFKVRLFSVCIPVLFSSIVAYFCLFFAKAGGTGLTGILRLAIYALAIVLLTLLLTACIKNALLYASVLPLYTLFSLLLSPVFFDLTIWMPVLKYASLLFLPKWYLM